MLFDDGVFSDTICNLLHFRRVYVMYTKYAKDNGSLVNTPDILVNKDTYASVPSPNVYISKIKIRRNEGRGKTRQVFAQRSGQA